MKIVIAYDGSAPSDTALEELTRAGIPGDADVHVVAVAEPWPMPVPVDGGTLYPDRPLHTVDDARAHAAAAAGRLHETFPGWRIESIGVPGSPTKELLGHAESWGADLVVVGSHSRSTVPARLGSISQQVVTSAHCSVRIARSTGQRRDDPVRLVLATDISADAETALLAILHRAWPAHSKVWIVTSVPETEPEERARVEEAHAGMTSRLRDAGLSSASAIEALDPKLAILALAQDVDADCIFIGARGRTPYQRALLGSISASVASRARCSVEVARR